MDSSFYFYTITVQWSIIFIEGSHVIISKIYCISFSEDLFCHKKLFDYRCASDCRSRGHEFDPGLVSYFRGDWSWNNIYGPLIHSRRVVVSYKRKCVHILLVNSLFKLTQEKVWLGELTVPHDHSCWLGRKATKQTNKQIASKKQIKSLLWFMV